MGSRAADRAPTPIWPGGQASPRELMSNSRHPIALRLERAVDGPERLLATVMLLPLLDGIFPALVLSGALDTVGGILQVGLLVFGGSATLAIILAEMDGSRKKLVRTVLLVGIPLILLASVEAALAGTIASALDLIVFERFAALVILAVAAKTASARIGEYLPRPAVIVGLGFVAAIDPAGAQLALAVDPELVARGAAAAVVGVGFALAVAMLAPTLREVVHLDRFRFGSAVALGLLPLSILGAPFGNAPLAVLALTAVFAYDPAGVEQPTPSEAALADGGEDERGENEDQDVGIRATPEMEVSGGTDIEEHADEPVIEQERPPWL